MGPGGGVTIKSTWDHAASLARLNAFRRFSPSKASTAEVFFSARDDLRRHREQRIGMGLHESADRGVAFRNPRSLVEQPRGIEEGREVDLHADAARGFETRDARIEQPRVFRVAEELQLVAAWYPETESGNRC